MARLQWGWVAVPAQPLAVSFEQRGRATDLWIVTFCAQSSLEIPRALYPDLHTPAGEICEFLECGTG